MSLSVNTNVAAVQSLSALHATQASMATSLTRLSTGLRINSAKDDPTGVIAVAALSKDIVDIDGHLGADQRAYFDSATAEGKLAQKSQMLLELKSLAVSSANSAGLSPDEKQANQLEVDSILSGLARLAGTSLQAPQQVDPQNVNHHAFNLSDLQSGGALDVDSGHSEQAVKVIDRAIRDTAVARAEIGSYQKYTVDSFDNVLQNTQINELEARSRLQDTDFAKEAANFVRSKALLQVNTEALRFSVVQSANALGLLK